MNCTIRYRRIGWAIRGWEEAHLKTIWTFLKILMKTFLVWCNANYVYIHRILLMNINPFKYFWNDIRDLTSIFYQLFTLTYKFINYYYIYLLSSSYLSYTKQHFSCYTHYSFLEVRARWKSWMESHEIKSNIKI